MAVIQAAARAAPLDYEVAWRPVKGQDERPKTARPLTALHATGRSVVDVGEKNGGPPTSAWTFMTFS